MKSERRHELQKNQLADWLTANVEKAKPYQNAILGVVLLVVVASVGYAWWSQRAKDKEAEGWDFFYAAMSEGGQQPGEFEDIIDQYPGAPVALWAAVIAGDLHLTQGCNTLLLDKTEANRQLHEAADLYLKLLDETRIPMLREQATFGLARAHEALGELKEAQQRYQELTEKWPQGSYAAVANARLKDLQKKSTKDWYDRFVSYTPTPSYSGGDSEGPIKPLDFENWDLLREEAPPAKSETMMDRMGMGDGEDKPQDAPDPTANGDADDPGAADTDATEPDTTDTDATEPDATASEGSEPDTTEPDATEPDTTEPAATEPAATEPDATEPDATDKDASDSDPADAETPDPGESQPDDPEDASPPTE